MRRRRARAAATGLCSEAIRRNLPSQRHLERTTTQTLERQHPNNQAKPPTLPAPSSGTMPARRRMLRPSWAEHEWKPSVAPRPPLNNTLNDLPSKTTNPPTLQALPAVWCRRGDGSSGHGAVHHGSYEQNTTPAAAIQIHRQYKTAWHHWSTIPGSLQHLEPPPKVYTTGAAHQTV